MVNARGGDGRKEIRGGARICVIDWTRGVTLRARNRATHRKGVNFMEIPRLWDLLEQLANLDSRPRLNSAS